VRVVAISDTHANSIQEFPTALLDSLRKADMIIHAGDYTSKVVLDQLKKISSFKGVCGNMDPPEIRLELPEKTIFDMEGRRIGIAHPVEGGAPFGIQNRIRKRFERVDLIVYGHTHNAKREQKGEVLFINPGSPTGMWPARAKTFAIIEINQAIEARIIQIQ
jgi:putative phosphoesterase